jgi:hypothetical protein
LKTKIILEGDRKTCLSKRISWAAEDEAEAEEPNGLITRDFTLEDELFTVKIIKNPGDAFYVRIVDGQNDVISEMRQSY